MSHIQYPVITSYKAYWSQYCAVQSLNAVEPLLFLHCYTNVDVTSVIKAHCALEKSQTKDRGTYGKTSQIKNRHNKMQDFQ